MNNNSSRAGEVRKRIGAIVQAIKGTMGSSLGPKGMDKMITQGVSTTITNDGSTILKMMKMKHPAAQLVCNISHSQDEQNGDGTTSVTLLLCALVEAGLALIDQKIHPVVVAEAMEIAKNVCKDTLEKASERAESDVSLRNCIKISLNSKIVNAYIDKITDVTMEAIRHSTAGRKKEVDVQNIRRVKIKGNMEETEVVQGIVLSNPLKGKTKLVPRRMKLALLQCSIGQAKPNLDAKITVSNYEAMEAVIKEEKTHVLMLCKGIKDKGIELVVMQKSIIRESVSELALHFLDRMGILVVDDVERKELELCVEQLGIAPVTDVLDIKETMIGQFEVEEVEGHVKIAAGEGVCTVVLRGTDDVILEEVDRSFNDAINVGRLVVKSPRVIFGGGVPELVCYTALANYSNKEAPKTSYCVQELAKGLLVIPELLAVNAGVSSISTVEDLVKRHSRGASTHGVSIKALGEGDMKRENIVQPLGVSISSISGAFDGASALVRIDDFIPLAR